MAKICGTEEGKDISENKKNNKSDEEILKIFESVEQFPDNLKIKKNKKEKDDKSDGDISFAKLLEKSELENSKKKTNNEIEGIAIIQDGILKYVNNASKVLTGYTPNEIKGKEFQEFVSPNYREFVLSRYFERLTGKDLTPKYEIELLSKDGSFIPVQIKPELITLGDKDAVMVFIKKISKDEWVEIKKTKFQKYINEIVDSKTEDIKEIINEFTNLVEEMKTEQEILKDKLEMESMVLNTILRCVSPANIKDVINTSLRDISRISGANHSFIYIIDDNNSKINLTHEWTDAGAESVKEDLRTLPIDIFKWRIDKLLKGETILIFNDSKLPEEGKHELEFLKETNSNSVLILPLFIDNLLFGFIGFNNIDETINWDDENLTVHRIFSELIGNIFGRLHIPGQNQ